MNNDLKPLNKRYKSSKGRKLTKREKLSRRRKLNKKNLSGGNVNYSEEELLKWFEGDGKTSLKFNNDNTLTLNNFLNNSEHTLLNWLIPDNEKRVANQEFLDNQVEKLNNKPPSINDLINLQSDILTRNNLLKLLNYFVVKINKDEIKSKINRYNYSKEYYVNGDWDEIHYIGNLLKIFINVCREINKIKDTQKVNLLRFNNYFIILLNFMSEPLLYLDLINPDKNYPYLDEHYNNKLEISLKRMNIQSGGGIDTDYIIKDLKNTKTKNETTKQYIIDYLKKLNSHLNIKDSNILFDKIKSIEVEEDSPFNKKVFNLEEIKKNLNDDIFNSLNLLSLYIIIILREFNLNDMELENIKVLIEKNNNSKKKLLSVIKEKENLLKYVEIFGDIKNKENKEIKILDIEIFTSSISDKYSQFIKSIKEENEILKLLKSNYKKENYIIRKKSIGL